MDISISFPVDTFTSAEALEFVCPFVHMPLLSINAHKSFPGHAEKFDLLAALVRLEKNRDCAFTLLSDSYDWIEAKNRIHFFHNIVTKIDYFVVALDDESNIYLDELIQAAGDYGMTFAYKTDPIKALWQSEQCIGSYEIARRPHTHLKKIFDPNMPISLQTRIDIGENPGHQIITSSMRLMAAPEMWFGPGCWIYFDQERVSSFPCLEDSRWVTPDLLHVTLFDANTPDYEEVKILCLQEQFRKWVRMREVESLLQAKLGN